MSLDGDTNIEDVSITDNSVGVSKNDIAQTDKATRVQRLEQEILNPNSTRNTGPLSTSPPLQESTPMECVQNVSSRPLNMIAPRQPYHPANEPQRRHQSLGGPLPIQNQNEPPNGGPLGPGGKRPPEPSMGGIPLPTWSDVC